MLSFLVVILFHVLQRLHVKVDSKDIIEFCSLIIGFLLQVVILLVYLNSQNALSSFIKSIIDKNLTSYPPQGIGALIEYSFKAVMTSPLLWMLSLYALFPPNKITTNGRIIALLFIASLIPTLVRQYSHYYIPGIAYASLLSSAALIDLWKMLPELKKKLYPAWVFCCISLIFLLAPLLFNLVVEYNILQKEHLLKDYFEVGGYINVNTKPTDKILVIAAEPQFYFLSQRDAVNEYTFIGYVDYYDGLEEKMIQDALNQNVRYFVVVENPYLYQYTGKVHDFIVKNSVLERTWPGKYPIKVYRKVK